MRICDINKPESKLEELTVMLTKGLTDYARSFTNAVIPDDFEEEATTEAYRALYNGAINFAAATMRLLMLRTGDDYQDEFIEEAKINICSCLDMIKDRAQSKRSHSE